MTITACPAKCGGAINTAERNDCADCGASLLVQEHPYGDPDRCTLRTKGPNSWGCHKRAGHATGSGGRHCSTHLDCGLLLGGGLVCGKAPGHDDGLHEVESGGRFPDTGVEEPHSLKGFDFPATPGKGVVRE